MERVVTSPQATTLALRARVAAMRHSRRRGARGVALIMVLGTLTILTFMLTEFQDSTAAELGSSVTTRDQVKAEYAAKSGLNLARLLLVSEPTMRRDLMPLFLMMREQPKQIPVWDFADQVLGAFNDAEGSDAFRSLSGLRLTETRNLGLAGAGFTLKIIDEDSKINFNLAARADTFSQQRAAEQLLSLIGGMQYNEYFEKRDADGYINDRATVCSAIIDWADPNTDYNGCNPRSESAIQSGAEDSFYELLSRPDQRKNAAYDSLQELHLVRGVTDEFWATFVEPNPDRPEERNVTVWGSGQVNVNTANPQTLITLACMMAVPDTPLCSDPVQQMQFLQTMKLLEGFAAGLPLFSTPEAFINTLQGKSRQAALLKATIGEFKPIKLLSNSEFLKAITVQSKVFSIYATGSVKSGKLETRTRLHAVIDLRGSPPPGGAEAYAKQLQMRQLGLAAVDPERPDQNPLLMPSPSGSVLYYRAD